MKRVIAMATVLIAMALITFSGCGMLSPTDDGDSRATNYYQCWVGGNGGGVNCTNHGNGSFQQYNCSGDGSSPINLSEHFNGWRNLGKSIGGQNCCIVASEAWSGSGSFDVTVSEASGSSSSSSSSGGWWWSGGGWW
ncbi:MAG: glycoside hydrolase family 11 protein [Spirochaetales bacterium]|nr:glycoside hydrolase family 11 protein [Spirochaetales bacterium]